MQPLSLPKAGNKNRHRMKRPLADTIAPEGGGQLPWGVRRVRILRLIHSRMTGPSMGLCINRKWCHLWRYEKDLRRVVKEGLAELKREVGGGRSRYTYMVLTQRGLQLIAQS